MDAIVGFLPVLMVALACPLMMLVMMRGMHGGHGNQKDSCHDTPASESGTERVQHLEREVALLREQVNAREPIATGPAARQLNGRSTSNVPDGR